MIDFQEKIHHNFNKIFRTLKQSIMTLIGTYKESQWAIKQYTKYAAIYKQETGSLWKKN